MALKNVVGAAGRIKSLFGESGEILLMLGASGRIKSLGTVTLATSVPAGAIVDDQDQPILDDQGNYIIP